MPKPAYPLLFLLLCMLIGSAAIIGFSAMHAGKPRPVPVAYPAMKQACEQTLSQLAKKPAGKPRNKLNRGGVNRPPEPVLRYCLAGGDWVEFSAAASQDQDGAITHYQWDFGDGNTAAGRSVSHHYSAPGRYNVTLRVIDDQAAQRTVLHAIRVGQVENRLALGGVSRPVEVPM